MVNIWIGEVHPPPDQQPAQGLLTLVLCLPLAGNSGMTTGLRRNLDRSIILQVQTETQPNPRVWLRLPSASWIRTKLRCRCVCYGMILLQFAHLVRWVSSFDYGRYSVSGTPHTLHSSRGCNSDRCRCCLGGKVGTSPSL